MKQQFLGWSKVSKNLKGLAESSGQERSSDGGLTWSLNDGQRASLHSIAERLPKNGVIIADEVGMGKTRIAVAVAKCVVEAGGRVAVLVPPGLGYQWQGEMSDGGIEVQSILRSFWGYFEAWGEETEENQRPWFNEDIILISHAFTNWRLGSQSAYWRWVILPEIYAQWAKVSNKRLPRKYYSDERPTHDWVQYVALNIASNIKDCGSSLAVERMEKLFSETPWAEVSDLSYIEKYRRRQPFRPMLENAVGLGLGTFDLVIIDEAHKSRSDESGLSRLLENVVIQGEETRRFALTATPIELDANQWEQMLHRIRVESAELKKVFSDYSKSVAKVRKELSKESTRNEFRKSASNFSLALSPYLVRRDKREDCSIKKFQESSSLPIHAYRHEKEIIIDTNKLTSAWKQVVCAAEALSFVTRQSDDPIAKRLRLTVGNGHGIAAILDQVTRDEELNSQQLASKYEGVSEVEPFLEINSKRSERAEWWKKILSSGLKNDNQSLYNHPVILAAVDAIEEINKKDEKVLVFGRFTKPMQALVQLLNAREMLRCLETNGRYWPQSKVHQDEESAVLSALCQLEMDIPLDKLNIKLEKQYRDLENQRRSLRDHLVNLIDNGLDLITVSERTRKLFNVFKTTVDNWKPGMPKLNDAHPGEDHLHNPLAVIANALAPHSQTSEEHNASEAMELAKGFDDLINAACERDDEGDDNGDGEIDRDEAVILWDTLMVRLSEEYSRSEGGFARLMNGATRQETRRLLQAAFNRHESYPRVLVAQSVVGREGLNLHKACRTVLLLHPEWNPGVVEQQIGRVDRVGSWWGQCLDKAIKQKTNSDDLPRIEILPVIFKGTYDEKNWEVLRSRWEDLRAQLHGVVISPAIAGRYLGAESIIKEINGSAPNFSPRKKV